MESSEEDLGEVTLIEFVFGVATLAHSRPVRFTVCRLEKILVFEIEIFEISMFELVFEPTSISTMRVKPTSISTMRVIPLARG